MPQVTQEKVVFLSLFRFSCICFPSSLLSKASEWLTSVYNSNTIFPPFITHVVQQTNIKLHSVQFAKWCHMHTSMTVTTINVMNISLTPKSFPMPFCNPTCPSPLPLPSRPHQPQATTDLLSVTIDEFAFPRIYKSVIIQNVLFFVSLCSSNIIILRFTHVVVHINSSFPFITEQILPTFF